MFFRVLFSFFPPTNLTSFSMIRFTSVRNRVTTSEILPGIAVKGMIKLIEETNTMDAHGR